jgi:hypothetical protein
LITHKLIAVATTTLFLFQIAMLKNLDKHLSWGVGGDCSIVEVLARTYTRRTSNSEEADIVKKAKT